MAPTHILRVSGGKQVNTQPLVGRVEAPANLRILKTKNQVWALLGLAGYYRQFVSKFASLVAPLSDLILKKNQKIVPWQVSRSPQYDQAF